MRVDVYCRACLKRRRVEGFPESSACACGESIALAWSEAHREGRPIAACAACQVPHLYIEKDFPASIGCAVMVGAVGAFLYWENLWILLGAAAVDGLLYLVLPWRTICYKCLTEYRGWPRNPEHQRYELTTAAQYATSARRPM